MEEDVAMNRLSCWLFVLVFALVVESARAQEKPRPPDRPPDAGFPGLGVRPLLPPALIEKLELNSKQKEQVEKLQKELFEKQKEAGTKLREAYEKAQKGGDPEAIRKVREQAQELFQGVAKHYREAEDKLKEILTEEQRKKYEQFRKEAPFGFPGGAPGAFPGGGFPGGFPGGGFRMIPGYVLPPPVQEMLKLTPEQKEKISKLQKEAEDKMMEVLTDEQKKQLEEMKKRAGGGPRPPSPG
jgi:Spy/CpxP family protein refolding chaperone